MRKHMESLALALIGSLVAFSVGAGYVAYGNAVSLSVTINTALTFTTTTDNFTTLTPGTSPTFATTTLRVATNDTSGYFVILSGDNKTLTVNTLISGANSIPDQTEWVNPAATTSAGNAVRISSLVNSQKVLAFRMMTASGTADTRISAWWGTTDSYTDSATTLWAGISSSTVSRKIMNSGSGSYSASDHLATVNYFLDVPATQPTGAYSGGLTYTATGN
jgi:hypothetical protein